MPKSGDFRGYSLLFTVLGASFMFVALFGNWAQFNDYSTPDNVDGFRGQSVFGLWEFCADGTRTGLAFNPPASDGSSTSDDGNSTSNDGTAQFSGCAHYGANYYTTIPVCGCCTLGGNPYCYNSYLKLFSLPDPPALLHVARAFAIMACIAAASVGCGNRYYDEDTYEEVHGQGLSCGSIVVVVFGAVSFGCFIGFTQQPWFYYTEPINAYADFKFSWAFNLFVAGWVFVFLGTVLQVLGIRKEAKEEAGEDVNEMATLTGRA